LRLLDAAGISKNPKYNSSRKGVFANKIMTKRLTNKILVLTLLVASAIAPAAYAQDRLDLCNSPQAIAESRSAARPRVATDQFIRTELFFGTDRQDGPDVSEEEFQQFLKKVITPRFPDGLTVLTGQGQFLNSKGQIIQETSKLVILLYPLDGGEDKSERIETIRERYKLRFQQESVLRVDDARPVRVSF
jgi:uncharacterized protein DUF3574